MEVDLKIHASLSKKQFGFTKDASTETTLHKIVHKTDRAILLSEMALGTFLDIKDAFDNVTFNALNEAITEKCPSTKFPNWNMAIIKSRSATLKPNDTSKTIKILKGCPQAGIFFPCHWNLVLDSLLNYAKDKIPCKMQGFADDIALLAIIETSSSANQGGFDANSIREITQKSLYAISEWTDNKCNEKSLSNVHLEEEVELLYAPQSGRK